MKYFLTWILAMAFGVIVSTSTAGDFPAEQWKAWARESSDRYPAEHWLQYATPEEAGWSSDKLAEAKAYFDSLDSAAVMLVHDGAVVVSWGDLDRRYMCHSVRKSLLSALVGIQVAAGKLDLGKTLAEVGVDDDPPLTDAEKQATIHDLLRSRSGVYHTAAYEPVGMKTGRPPRGSHKPGEFFWYNNWDFNTLGAILEKETGVKIFEGFKKYFADPLRMEDYRVCDGYYHLERQHSIHPAYPFRLSARDMARFGLLYLREGRWKDRQILPREWVRASIKSHFNASDTTPNPNYAYGYYWWLVVKGPLAPLGMYSARGYGGHSIDVIPGANVVFVHRVNTFGDSSLGMKMDMVHDPERFELLQRILQARTAPPKKKPKLTPLAAAEDARQFVDVPPDSLMRFVGTYRFEKFTFDVKQAGDRLKLYGSKFGHFFLKPLSEKRFLIDDLELPIRFETDKDGNPVRMIGEFVPNKPIIGKKEG